MLEFLAMDFGGSLAILLFFGTPLLIAVVLGMLWHANRLIKHKEVEQARRSYESMVREKLDVIKTAIAMDYSSDDLRYLDSRLEEIIGADAMRSLLDPKQPQTPTPSAELHEADLQTEVENLQHVRDEREQPS
jgi:hypothetical protein